MTELLAVDPEVLRRHADRVRTLADEAGRAAVAARSVSFTPLTYGRIGAALVHPFLMPLEAAGVAAAGAASVSLVDTADAVTALAGSFDAVDDLVAGVVSGLRGWLP